MDDLIDFIMNDGPGCFFGDTYIVCHREQFGRELWLACWMYAAYEYVCHWFGRNPRNWQ